MIWRVRAHDMKSIKCRSSFWEPSSSDPSLNGNLYYPNNIDRSLNEAADDKTRKYRADYNNKPPSAVSLMPAIAITSWRLHSEFIRLLFLQDNRKTDRFFAASGVRLAQTNSGLFHFRRAAFSSQLKAKVGNTLVKAAALRLNLNIDIAPITSRAHTHSSHFQFPEQPSVCEACRFRALLFTLFSLFWQK
jgi:hypothetical protein